VKLSKQDLEAAELFGRSVWSVRPGALRALTEQLKITVQGGGLSPEALEAMRKLTPKAATEVGPSGGGKVAIIPLAGIITPRGGLMSMLMGGSYWGLMGFREELREAANDEEVATIVLAVDSPGGLVDLVPETAAEVAEVAAQKKVVAVATTEICSAAYWITSQASEIIASPSSKVGSVGVFLCHQELSRMAEEEGVTITTFRFGQFKAEGNIYEQLTDAAKEHLQGIVDTVGGMFINDVAAGRGVSAADVEANYGEGRAFYAAAAVEMGLADGVGTLEQVVADLTGGSGGSRSGATAEDEKPAPADLPVASTPGSALADVLF
jgi:signal peptide peptidase SppA